MFKQLSLDMYFVKKWKVVFQNMQKRRYTSWVDHDFERFLMAGEWWQHDGL